MPSGTVMYQPEVAEFPSFNDPTVRVKKAKVVVKFSPDSIPPDVKHKDGAVSILKQLDRSEGEYIMGLSRSDTVFGVWEVSSQGGHYFKFDTTTKQHPAQADQPVTGRMGGGDNTGGAINGNSQKVALPIVKAWKPLADAEIAAIVAEAKQQADMLIELYRYVGTAIGDETVPQDVVQKLAVSAFINATRSIRPGTVLLGDPHFPHDEFLAVVNGSTAKDKTYKLLDGLVAICEDDDVDRAAVIGDIKELGLSSSQIILNTDEDYVAIAKLVYTFWHYLKTGIGRAEAAKLANDEVEVKLAELPF